MLADLIVLFAVVLARILAALVLTAGSIYAGMGILDRLTSGIEEWAEVKKGNVAIALLMVSVVISLVMLILPLIDGVVLSIRSDMEPARLTAVFAFSLLNYMLGLLAGTFLIFLTINLIDRITPDIEEFSELKKGNLAVALIFAAAVLLVSFVARAPFESLFGLLQMAESALI
jgi:uncharacterized membrane protein YjfL (UPF0719 family)